MTCGEAFIKRSKEIPLRTCPEPRACYTEWSQKQKKQISYINAYVWNLEKWYWWTYLQDRNRDAGIENRLWTLGEEEDGTNWEMSIDKYTLPCVKYIASGKPPYRCRELSLVLCDDLEGWDGVKNWRGDLRRRGHMYTYGWFMLCGRSQHHIIRQLSPN